MVEVLQLEIQVEHHIPLDIEEPLRHILEQVHFLIYHLTLEVQDVIQHLLIIMVLSSTISAYSGNGKYITSGSATSSAAESAIAAGCIVVASAGNNNTKTF